MKRKKEVIEEPKKWHQKLKNLNWHNIILISLFIFLIGFTIKNSFDLKKAVKKEVINNYICQVVGSDEEIGVLALRCMTK